MESRVGERVRVEMSLRSLDATTVKALLLLVSSILSSCIHEM